MPCTCDEYRDDETGEYSDYYCLSCRLKDGWCECGCLCDQCEYTDTPCGYVAPGTCLLCIHRSMEQTLKDAQVKRELYVNRVLTIPSSTALNTITTLIDPCIHSLKYAMGAILDDSEYIPTIWAIAVHKEIKNCLASEPCGILQCTCHLRKMYALIGEKKGPDSFILSAQIVAMEDGVHAASAVVVAAMDKLDAAKFSKNVAFDMMEEVKWDTGDENSNPEITAMVATATKNETQAYEAYEKAVMDACGPTGELNRLLDKWNQ